MDMRKGTLIENMSHPKEELSDHLEYNCGGTPSESRLGSTSITLIIRLSQEEQYTIHDFAKFNVDNFYDANDKLYLS
jgi:hypothetical protein